MIGLDIVKYLRFSDLYLISIVLSTEVVPGTCPRRLCGRMMSRGGSPAVFAHGLLADHRVLERLLVYDLIGKWKYQQLPLIRKFTMNHNNNLTPTYNFKDEILLNIDRLGFKYCV